MMHAALKKTLLRKNSGIPGIPNLRAKCFFWVSLFFVLSIVPAVCGADLTVAVIKSDSVLPFEDVLEGFRAGIKQRNPSVDFVILEADRDRRRINDLATVVRPDLILCLGLKALEQASRVRDTPKIFSLITYENIQPWSKREDISGVSLDLAPAVQFRVIRQAFPGARRVGVLYDPDHNRKLIEEATREAAAAGFTLQTLPVDTMREIPFAFEKLEKNIDLLWALYDQTVYNPEAAKYILMQSLQKKVPVIGFSPHFAKAGAILALYGDYRDMGRQASLQALAVLNGEENVPRLARPGTVKIAINEKVARFLGITFPVPFMKTVGKTY